MWGEYFRINLNQGSVIMVFEFLITKPDSKLSLHNTSLSPIAIHNLHRFTVEVSSNSQRASI